MDKPSSPRYKKGNRGHPAKETNMRKPLAAPAILVLILLSAPVRAGEADTVLSQAIEAHGGDKALARTRLMIQTLKGEITSLDTSVPATCEETLQLPDRCRWSYEMEVKAQKVTVQLALNGDKGWRSPGGAVKELTKAEFDEVRERAYAAWLTTLLPLREKGFELKVLPEIMVGDSPAIGLLATHKDRPDVKLYFDAKTHLLVKVERRAKEAGQEVTRETIFNEPKAFDGVKLATRRQELANGKKTAEWTLTGCRFPDKVDESVFAKP
jgi:hypothetical protein